MAPPRQARVRAYAKLNLDLKVLNRGADGFHEIRSVFQTISLHDTLEIAYTPSKATSIRLHSAVAIADNLVVRAVQLLLDAMRATGQIEIRLEKRIPMGAGLGGGSSDAAATLLALPALAGWRVSAEMLHQMAGQLGSDVPFFLLGGAAVVLNRGTELYPLPDLPRRQALVVAPEIHVSTPEAYRALNRDGDGKLTELERVQYIDSFQSRVWRLGEALSRSAGGKRIENDFEGVVFPRHPALESILKQLVRSGADLAGMTGSGSALFGVFSSQDQARKAAEAFGRVRRSPSVFPVSFLDRSQYRAAWWRQLQKHMDGKVWLPQSRHTQRRRNE